MTDLASGDFEMDAAGMGDPMRALVARWRGDGGGTYQSWFLWAERLKNFRSIRRGLETVVKEIDTGAFGTEYKGSSLETVVKSIAERLFRGRA